MAEDLKLEYFQPEVDAVIAAWCQDKERIGVEHKRISAWWRFTRHKKEKKLELYRQSVLKTEECLTAILDWIEEDIIQLEDEGHGENSHPLQRALAAREEGEETMAQFRRAVKGHVATQLLKQEKPGGDDKAGDFFP